MIDAYSHDFFFVADEMKLNYLLSQICPLKKSETNPSLGKVLGH